jgi:(E)-4-hydroxy-3-methylbut-2-enyl-diphosphate synthase
MFRLYPVRQVNIGDLPLGASHPVAVQTMTNTPTLLVDETVAQCIRCIDAGSQLVRISAKNITELKAIGAIRQRLRAQGIDTPVIADIHFSALLAIEAAHFVEKVRINPGNFYKAGSLDSDEVYFAEIRKNLKPLIEICAKNNVAIRVGTNQGSLSERIVSRFGTGAEAMAQASMEFVRLIAETGFQKLILSVKASSAVENIRATRLLASMQHNEGYSFPLHLGVTEAGLGFSGRIKSAVGIGALLADGIGDTIRVSLTEAPEHEIPVAIQLSGLFQPQQQHFDELSRFQRDAERFQSTQSTFKVIGTIHHTWLPGLAPDVFAEDTSAMPAFTETRDKDISIEMCSESDHIVIVTEGKNSLYDFRRMYSSLPLHKRSCRIIWKRLINDDNDFLYRFAAEFGNLLASGLLSGIWIEGNRNRLNDTIKVVFEVLQVCNIRNTHAGFVSCPSCSRTSFDIMHLAEEVRSRTYHLTGLTIAVMGCIVNGPGEMGAADFGLLGQGKGLLALYHKGKILQKNIPENQACDVLLKAIKDNSL